ncbi:helix-turn-helix domain-containing protein [Butyrivibrio sp. AC2005]|uniref:helix-turn-helix domain-containing protein n=1 Tax=Butyrivibrio sp. AC2005 TaxID=1280672 RepID=UPI00047D26DB|nr:helix-turn-helix transcriptional regulator [Butyrivibrio sp. AC2005]
MGFGTIKINLEEQLKKSGLSKNKFAQRAELQRTQLNHYLSGDISLLDRAVLGRMCTVLQCRIEDILEFIPPQE